MSGLLARRRLLIHNVQDDRCTYIETQLDALDLSDVCAEQFHTV